MTVLGDEQYATHVAGKKHRKAVELFAEAQAAAERANTLPDINSLTPCCTGYIKKCTRSAEDAARMKFETRWMEIRGPYLTYALDKGMSHKGVIHLVGTEVIRTVNLPPCYDGHTAESEANSVPVTPAGMTPLCFPCEGVSPLPGTSSPLVNPPAFILGESYAERSITRERSFTREESEVSEGGYFGGGFFATMFGGGGGGGVIHAPEFTLQVSGGALGKDLFLVFDTEEMLVEWKSALVQTISRSNAEELEAEERALKMDSSGGVELVVNEDVEGAFTYKKPELSDFELITTVGRGSFGKVMKVKRRNEVFAMKVLTKESILHHNIVDKIHNERNSLSATNHPFLAALHLAFQTQTHLYLVTKFYPGGDLRFHLRSRTKFGENMAQFYCAQLTLALEHLHQKHILYRDLKPANVVLGADGYAVLTDFGMAKRVKKRRANSFCGTDIYIAPEIVAGDEYGEAVDWWSLGVVLYEMLVGSPPFTSETPEQLYLLIQQCEVPYPHTLSASASKILHGLLQKSESARLGRRSIKKEAFFSTMDWAGLLAKEVPPPFKPNVEKSDTRYFDASVTNEAAAITRCNGALAKKQNEGFVGFSYPRLSCS